MQNSHTRGGASTGPRQRSSASSSSSRPRSGAPSRSRDYVPSSSSRLSGGARPAGGFRGASSSSSGRPSRSYNSAPSRGGRGGGAQHRTVLGGRGGGFKMKYFSDISVFINKAKTGVTKEVKHVPTHQSFAEFGFRPELVKNIIDKKYSEPTPIQDQIIPHVMKHVDVVGLANTGTGKTAAFLLPLIHKILNDRTQQILILAPTRELALQIDEECKGFARGMRIHSVVCVGGMSIVPQMRQLHNQHNIIIGTPGRVMDLMRRGNIHLETFHTIVLDEADRMLDMGFIHDMRFVMSHMPTKRHTLFFSATMSNDIKVLVKDFLRDPITVSVVQQATSKNIDQDVIRYGTEENKFTELCRVLEAHPKQKILIFGRQKHGVKNLERDLMNRGFSADSLHGNKTHAQRVRAMEKFKEGRVSILVATDVAARGLDIKGIHLVINYELPESHDDYVHRIGRTGRGEHQGKALTFIK